MDNLTHDISEKLLTWGADIVGIAPVERFDSAPRGHHPRDFLPSCKSVISIALHLFNGLGEVWGDHDEMNKTNTPYLFYGYGLTNLESSRIVNRGAKYLEYRGHDTLAFMPTWTTSTMKYLDETLQDGVMKAEISHRHAAVAAGIAEFGWSGLALTPEFGSMQRFNTLLTSADLTPTPLYDGPPLCDLTQCNKKCARKCPAAALSPTESQSCEIAERKMEFARCDHIRCSYSIFGLIEGSGGWSNMKIPEGKGDAMRFFSTLHSEKVHMYDRTMHENCFGLICGDFCGKCMHQCPSAKIFKKNHSTYNLTERTSSINRLDLF